MSADPEALTDLAASIADGAPIDWEMAEVTLGDREQRLVRHLRLVSSVAELYRSLPADPGDPIAEAAEPQGPRWGHLVILESLGKGTTAEVYRAWDVALQREVALKLFPPTEGERRGHAGVLSEARRLARVRHPNVATVYGAERQADRVGFWMELVRGTSLDETLERQGPFGAREAAVIGGEIASALAAVHGAGLLHRDVKAQNVLREAGGRIVLADFGTGEEVGAPGPVRMAGTPMYLAPEILKGQPASIQSDIYSLGVLLFLLTTGRFPIAATTMMDLARGHAAQTRARLRDLRPDLPAPFIEAVETALAHAPADRFASAGAFEDALRRTLDVPGAVRTPGDRPVTRTGRRLPLYIAFAALIVLLVAFSWWKRTPVEPGGPRRIESLAVMPLVDTTGTSPQLADGMTDQLIATLGQIGALRVTSRDSVLALRGKDIQPAEIARTLGVSAVLQGSIAATRPAGAGARRVRITARLLAAGSGAELWSGSFDAALGDLAAIESDMAKSIARGIRLAVSPREADRLGGGGRTSPQAEEAYFQGRYYLNQYGVDSGRRARAAFERAIELDPSHAQAHAALARTYVALGFNGALSQPEARARALAAATRALELDPEASEGHTALADLRFYYDWDWKGADAAYTRAIDLSPSGAYARSQYARYLAAAGRLQDAIAQAVQAAALDPLSTEAAQTEGLIRYYARDFTGAHGALERAIGIDPNYARAHYVLGRVLEAEGRIPEALTAAGRGLALAREPGSSWLAQASRLHALAGDRDRARAEVVDLARSPLRVHPENLAYTYLALGDRDRALALLEQAVDERDPSILWLGVDPRVDPLRNSPAFDRLLTRLGIPRNLDRPKPRQ